MKTIWKSKSTKANNDSNVISTSSESSPSKSRPERYRDTITGPTCRIRYFKRLLGKKLWRKRIRIKRQRCIDHFIVINIEKVLGKIFRELLALSMIPARTEKALGKCISKMIFST